MSIWKRFTGIFKAKANKALDRMEDTGETLDLAYEQQLELLAKVKRGVADVATARKRLELQMADLTREADKLGSQARQAVAAGQEDLAREALTRKAAKTAQLADLESQVAHLREEETKVIARQRELQTAVDAFRTRKETIKATTAAAKAQVAIGEATTGMAGGFGEIGQAVERATARAQELEARAAATHELVETGALQDTFGALGGGDDISRKLNALTAQSNIDDELAALKGELGAGPATKAIGS